MSNKNAPIATHRDGAISSKVWKNLNKEGQPYYSVTFQRTYTNPQTHQIAEAQSFSGTDILKLQQLASESYNSISMLKARDKLEHSQTQTQRQEMEPPLPTIHEPQELEVQGLEAQHDIAMADAEPDRVDAPMQAPTYER